MALKDYYQLLEIAPAAPPDEVKRAFRLQIARYHPDKVQHLGKEFQNMAADRAAELTEAYRILSDEGRRAEYDRARQAAGAAAPAPPAGAPSGATSPSEPSAHAAPPPPAEAERPKGAQFKQERATRDQFVHKATVGRFRQGLTAIGGDYDESPARGFDVALVPKSKLFGRGKGPRLLASFVPSVDRQAVAETWAQAVKWGAPGDEICVFLMGTSLAPVGELAAEIENQRRKGPRGSKVTLIPVDARNWDAHMPLDAPAIAKTLLARLKTGG